MTVSTRLKEIRTAAGLTQQEVAAVAGVNRSLISQIERYGKDVTVETLEGIVTACGAHLVITRNGDELASLQDDERRLVLALREMGDLGQEDRQQLAARFVACLPHMDRIALAVIEPAIQAACSSSVSKGEEAILPKAKAG